MTIKIKNNKSGIGFIGINLVRTTDLIIWYLNII